MEYDIVPLPKDQWKGTTIPLTTRNDSYYDFEITPLNSEGCTVSIVRKPAEKEIVHTPEEYDFPDSLYQDHWEKAEAYGVVNDSGEMLACIEVCPEEWSNRLMVTELWVDDALQGKGIGKRLMDKAKEIAVRQGRRVIRRNPGFVVAHRVRLSRHTQYIDFLHARSSRFLYLFRPRAVRVRPRREPFGNIIFSAGGYVNVIPAPTGLNRAAVFWYNRLAHCAILLR